MDSTIVLLEIKPKDNIYAEKDYELKWLTTVDSLSKHWNA